MPLRLVPYEQQIAPQGGGRAPRAQAPDLGAGFGGQLTRFALAGAQMYGDLAKEALRTRRETDLTERLGKATAELAELELGFEQDADFKTSPQRFQQGADAIKAKHLKDADQVVQQAFTKRFQELALSKSINVRKDAFRRERDWNVSTLDTSLDVYATTAANAKNPEERDVIDNQARLALAAAVTTGAITQEDAGKRERRYLGRLDEATVLRDMQLNPSLTADKLALDPAYASRIDPVQRERYVNQAYTRAESIRTREDARIRDEHKARGDELLKDAWAKLEKGQLTRDYIEQNRAFWAPGEYHALLRGVREKKEAGAGTAAAKNDESAVADVYRKLYVDNDPAAAERLAFQYQRNGLMKSTTLGTVLGVARSQSRQEGPRTEYERSKGYIASMLDPGQNSMDPAPKARIGVAMREIDDFVAGGPGGKRTDEEIRKRTDEVVKKYQLIDMNDLVTKTGMGVRNDPQATLDRVAGEGQRLQRDRDAKRISDADFNKKMRALNDQRRAAEAALSGANSGRK